MFAGVPSTDQAWTAAGLEEGQFRLRILNLLKELPSQVSTEGVTAQISHLSANQLNIAVLSLFSQLFQFAADELKRFEKLKTRALSLEGQLRCKRESHAKALANVEVIESRISRHPIVLKAQENELQVSESDSCASLKQIGPEYAGRLLLDARSHPKPRPSTRIPGAEVQGTSQV